MKKKLAILFFIAPTVLVLSGCSLPGSRGSIGSFVKTTDGGATWETRVKIDEEQNIGGVNVLSFAIDPMDTKQLYLGTEADGMYLSKNGGETWEKTNLGVQKIYDIIIDSQNNQSLYASGVWNGRGKIFHTENGGKDWVEVYSEPSNRTIIYSLAMSILNSSVLYAGTSEGMIFKTTDGGKSWANLYKVRGIVSDIVFDTSGDEVVYFGIFNSGILKTKDHGVTFENIADKIKKAGFSANVNTITVDPTASGTVFLGVNGAVLKSKNFGDSWESMNILETSKKFPIKSIAINPKNYKEIFYAGGQVLYKSIDGGVQWSTYQLDTTLTVQLIKYDLFDPLILYMGMGVQKK